MGVETDEIGMMQLYLEHSAPYNNQEWALALNLFDTIIDVLNAKGCDVIFLRLPSGEQVWDGVSNVAVQRFSLGEGTNSATPLAWPHAEYIKLVRSYRDEANFSRFPNVAARYGSGAP